MPSTSKQVGTGSGDQSNWSRNGVPPLAASRQQVSRQSPRRCSSHLSMLPHSLYLGLHSEDRRAGEGEVKPSARAGERKGRVCFLDLVSAETGSEGRRVRDAACG